MNISFPRVIIAFIDCHNGMVLDPTLTDNAIELTVDESVENTVHQMTSYKHRLSP